MPTHKVRRSVRERAQRVREKIRLVEAGILPEGFEEEVDRALRRKTNAGRDRALDSVEHNVAVYKILARMPKRGSV
ncbi:hypothetical protein HY732_01085 [Candidatus Uhrbacteria bacterium]|nr:hypothetical protein [Candidatus Uhrbacteria bacterium]